MQNVSAIQVIMIPCIMFVCYYSILLIADGIQRKNKKKGIK
jgi:hypothetical protein